MCTGTPKYNWRKNSLIVTIDNHISKMASLKFCGPKLSAGCTVLSIWGIIQLGLMGLLFYIKSVALVPDLTLNKTETSYHRIRQVCINLAHDSIVQMYLYACNILTYCYYNTIFVHLGYGRGLSTTGTKLSYRCVDVCCNVCYQHSPGLDQQTATSKITLISILEADQYT